jgi:hypothetical protein
VFGAHVRMAELASFTHRQLEHLLRARGIWQIGPSGLGCFSLLDRLLDLLLDLVQLDGEVLQYGGGDPLTLPDEAEQDVLRSHVFVVEPCGFLARHRKDLPHPLSEVVAVHSPSERPRVDVLSADRPCFLFQCPTHIACASQVRLALGQRSSFRGR